MGWDGLDTPDEERPADLDRLDPELDPCLWCSVSIRRKSTGYSTNVALSTSVKCLGDF
jgi:hypothetical protein